MNYTELFYWLTVADNAKTMFTVGIVIFTAVAVISTILNFICRGDGDDRNADVARKWMWWSYPFVFLFWSLFIFTPSKKDALLIVAGGQTMNFLTTDSTAKQIPHELSNFVVTELKNMASEAKVDLNIKDQKQKILDEAEGMTAKELMEKIKVDSTFAKVILEK
jgi:hypothetical protein